MKRSEIREQAFILTFEKLFNPDLSIRDLSANASECELFESDDFAVALADATQQHMEEIDAVLVSFSKKWSVDRLPKVTLSVLRLAVCEIKYFDEIPTPVSINEAVELAKKYAAAEDASFINGVLGAFVRSGETKDEEKTEEEPETVSCEVGV